jgi:hypothetical protein
MKGDRTIGKGRPIFGTGRQPNLHDFRMAAAARGG